MYGPHLAFPPSWIHDLVFSGELFEIIFINFYRPFGESVNIMQKLRVEANWSPIPLFRDLYVIHIMSDTGRNVVQLWKSDEKVPSFPSKKFTLNIAVVSNS